MTFSREQTLINGKTADASQRTGARICSQGTAGGGQGDGRATGHSGRWTGGRTCSQIHGGRAGQGEVSVKGRAADAWRRTGVHAVKGQAAGRRTHGTGGHVSQGRCSGCQAQEDMSVKGEALDVWPLGRARGRTTWGT